MPETRCCRLCGATALTRRFALDPAPRNINRVLAPGELSADASTVVSVYQCGECGLVQLVDQLPPDAYEDYVMTVSHSAQMREYQRGQALAFVRDHGLAGKRIVEVGCGDGNYMQYLAEAGATVEGVEPSAPFRRLAEKTGFPVHGGYVDRERPITDPPYDGFATRQVLEHVPDINSFLQGIARITGPAAVGLVEVPSLEQALEGGRFYDFFPDHLNYYSAGTLRHALERNRFDVLDVSRGMNGEYNVAIVRKRPEPDFGLIERAIDTLTRDLRAFVADQTGRGKRVAVWGAGGKGVTSMAVARLSGVAYVVDSDPHKQGRLTPVTHLPIVPPDTLLSDPVDAVILTALAYRNEVLAELRDRLRFRGTIAILGPELEVVPPAGGQR